VIPRDENRAYVQRVNEHEYIRVYNAEGKLILVTDSDGGSRTFDPNAPETTNEGTKNNDDTDTA